MLNRLEEEARTNFLRPGCAPEFSSDVFFSLVAQWRAWQRGIPPSRAWLGYGGQNPYLMAAFAVLDKAEAEARAIRENRAARRGESPAEFHRRAGGW